MQLRRETKYVAKLEKVLVDKDLLPSSLKELLLHSAYPFVSCFSQAISFSLQLIQWKRKLYCSQWKENNFCVGKYFGRVFLRGDLFFSVQ